MRAQSEAYDSMQALPSGRVLIPWSRMSFQQPTVFAAHVSDKRLDAYRAPLTSSWH